MRGRDFWKENVVEYAGGTKEKAGAGGCRVGWKTAQISGMPMCKSGWWFLNPDLWWEKNVRQTHATPQSGVKGGIMKQK